MNEDSSGAVNRVGTDHLRDGHCLRDQPNPVNLACLPGACWQRQGSCRGTKPNNEVAPPHSTPSSTVEGNRLSDEPGGRPWCLLPCTRRALPSAEMGQGRSSSGSSVASNSLFVQEKARQIATRSRQAPYQMAVVAVTRSPRTNSSPPVRDPQRAPRSQQRDQ